MKIHKYFNYTILLIVYSKLALLYAITEYKIYEISSPRQFCGLMLLRCYKGAKHSQHGNRNNAFLNQQENFLLYLK